MPTRSMTRAVQIFRTHGDILRTSQAMQLGIHPRTLYSLRNNGTVEQLSRGLYCLSDHAVFDQPDLVAATLRVPKGVVCLISALAFHDMTTQIPRSVAMAIPRRMRSPVIDHPPMTFHRFNDACYGAGIDTHNVQGVRMRIYSPEKTIADCFRFRTRIGMDVILEALRLYRERKQSSSRKLLHYAAICRVEKVMAPYLEAEFSPRVVVPHKPLDYPGLGDKVSRSVHSRVAEAAAVYADTRKRIIIIAGPNGAGKTTFAREFLPREAACSTFVNADYIAAGLSPFAPDVAAIKAGKLMLREIRDHVRKDESFALETTLAGQRYIKAIAAWQDAGYGVKLIFLQLRSVDLAIRRVAVRVAQGGHDIPEATIRRRYTAGWHHFNTLYKPLVDAWALYDNSNPQPRLIEEGVNK